MKADYNYGFGGIKEVLAGDVEQKDSLEELEIKADSKIIIVPKIIGVYQTPRPNPKRQRDAIDFILQSSFSMFPFPGQAQKINPGLICIGYDPTIITPEILRDFMDARSSDRLKVTEYHELPDFRNKKADGLSKLPNKMIKDLIEGGDANFEKYFNEFNKAREEYGLSKFEHMGYHLSNLLRDKNYREEKRRSLQDIVKRMGIPPTVN